MDNLKHHSKQKKPDIKEHILYDCFYEKSRIGKFIKKGNPFIVGGGVRMGSNCYWGQSFLSGFLVMKVLE